MTVGKIDTSVIQGSGTKLVIVILHVRTQAKGVEVAGSLQNRLDDAVRNVNCINN